MSTLKNKQIKINNILIEKNKDKTKFPDFEQNHYSVNSTGFYKIGRDSIRIIKWICYYDRSHYENMKYFDLMGSVSKCLNEISQR